MNESITRENLKELLSNFIANNNLLNKDIAKAIGCSISSIERITNNRSYPSDEMIKQCGILFSIGYEGYKKLSKSDKEKISEGIGTVGGGVLGFGSTNVTLGLAIGDGDAALIIGGGSSLGFTGKPDFSGGITGNFHDNYGGNKDVLAGLGGTDVSVQAGYGLMGSYSTSAEKVGNTFKSAESGVRSYGIGAGYGMSYGVSEARSYKFSDAPKAAANILVPLLFNLKK